MTRTSLQHLPCSLARTADLVGDKWILLILRDAFYGLQTFTQFQKNLSVARNILSDRLAKLVENDILIKVANKPGVARFSYKLTEQGKALYPAVMALTQWGDKWIFGNKGEPVRFLDKKNHAPILPIVIQARDGRYLQCGDVSYEPGPSASPTFFTAYERSQSQDAAN